MPCSRVPRVPAVGDAPTSPEPPVFQWEMLLLPVWILYNHDVSVWPCAVGGELVVSKVDKRAIRQHELRVFQMRIQPLVAIASAKKVRATSRSAARWPPGLVGQLLASPSFGCPMARAEGEGTVDRAVAVATTSSACAVLLVRCQMPVKFAPVRNDSREAGLVEAVERMGASRLYITEPRSVPRPVHRSVPVFLCQGDS